MLRTVRKYMSLTRIRSIEIPLNIENYAAADEFIKQWMKQKRIGDRSVFETTLLFEALFQDMIEQGYGQDTVLTIKAQKAFGEYNITLGFEGESYVPSMKKDQKTVSPELQIVQAYSDKVGYRYRSGYNRVSIVVKRNHNSSLMYCLIAIILAMLVATPLIAGYQQSLLGYNPYRWEKAAEDQRLEAARRQLSYDLHLIAEEILALITGPLIADVLYSHQGYFRNIGLFSSGMTITEFINSLVPDNIFEPFETIMPFPIIILALLLTYALCSIGEYFGAVHRFINISLAIFSKMLTVVMFTLPFFCFFAALSMLMIDGIANLTILLELLIIVALSMIVISGFYLIRLIIGKVKIKSFVKHLPALLWENFKISSVIDAVPFNIRYCSRKYGYDVKRLSDKLPILAQTNLDGNCFLIMLISMSFIFLLGIDISWLQIIGIAFLILFLSVGAPNQPGSIMIGMLIITMYVHANELMLIAIFAEVFFGWLQNIINVY